MKHYGLIGRPLGHSASATYFNAKFADLAIDAQYLLYELESIEQVEALRSKLSGFNVTIPYKRAILPYLSSISEEAKLIGAVNCVKIDQNGDMHGYNTDVIGIRQSLSQYDIAGMRALVLGTGGAAAAVISVLKSLNMDIVVVSRTKSDENIGYQDIDEQLIASCKLIVNATPVGMYPHIEQCPTLPYLALTADHILFDLIYNPDKTLFLSKGAQQGATTISGSEMFRCQAEASWTIWNR